jgi:integrase
MSLFKRGKIYWYEFEFKGKRYRKTTHLTNEREAQKIEAARYTQLAKGEVGIQDRKPVPTLREFAPRFQKAVAMQCAEKPLTVAFYEAKLKTLLADESLAGRRLDTIDESVIEEYTQNRGTVKSRRKKSLAPGSINRELATLRRLLRLAHEWKEIQRVPRVRLLRGERNREFVLSPVQEPIYLAACPAPLADVAVVLLDTGLRLGEALSLEWPQVRLEPAQNAKFGYVTVLSGKAKSRKSRNVPLSERAVAILKKWGTKDGGFVFHRHDNSPLPDSQLDQQHARVRKLLKLPIDFVLHSLRHTFGTRLGEAGADAFTVMKLMGHSTVTVSQRYVHPSPEAVELAFERLTALNLRQVPTNLPTVEQGSEGMVQ